MTHWFKEKLIKYCKNQYLKIDDYEYKSSGKEKKVNKKRNCHADLPQNEDSAWQFEYVK